MDLIKNWQVILLVAMLAVSMISIAPWPKSGVVVSSIEGDSDLVGKLSPNDIIYKVNGQEATVKNFENISGLIEFETSRGVITQEINNSGIMVAERPFTNIKFGLDIEGGILAVVEPVDNVSEAVVVDIKSILEKRMSSLRESTFQVIKYNDKNYIQIQIAGGTEEDLKKIINTTGVFEAKIPLLVDFSNGTGKMKYGETKDWLSVKYLDNETVDVAGTRLSIGNATTINNITMELWNISSSRADIAVTVYKNDGNRKDVVKVYIDPQHSFVQSAGNGYYNWQFSVEVNPSASQSFYDAVRNMNIKYSGTEPYLESKIYLFLDGKGVSNLSIGSTLKNKAVTISSVSGYSSSKESAQEEKRFLQNVLQSGALPSELKILTVKNISPKLGQGFLTYTLMALIAAIVSVSAIIFIRYRNLKISSFVILTCLSEVVILVGASVFIGWTLDLASIAAVLSIVGTGVDQQVMIVDEIMMGERSWSLKAKIKRALFIVFGSAGTLLAAMLPLMLIGFGMLRGFAITTSLGVLIAILITRPAFTTLVERILNK